MPPELCSSGKSATHDGVDSGLGACHKFEECNQKQNLVFNWRGLEK